MLNRKTILLLLTSVFVLAGCSGKKEEQKLTIQNFDVIDTYDYDKVKVVIEEDKDPQELAYDVLMESMGLNNEQSESYKEVGISEKNGVFINAGILEGSEIPTVSGYSAEDVAQLQSGKDKSEAIKLKEFQELQQNRERKVSFYDEDKVMEETAEKIKQAAKEQEMRREEQKQKKAEQDAGKGDPEFEIEDVE